MIKSIFVVAALAASALSIAGTSTAEVSGTYVLKLGEEATSLCTLLELPLPESKLVLDESAHFTLKKIVNGQTWQNQGTFAIQRSTLILYGKRFGKKVDVRPGRLIIDGLVYEKQPTCDLVGSWVLVQMNGAIDTSSKLVFSGNGRFRYNGLGGTSSGTYEAEGGCINLTYTEVDGQMVDEPFHGRAYRTSDGFKIDRYRFVRA